MGSTARDLDAWPEPFLDVVGHKKRRTWAPLYLRGLLGPGERKSLQPMAARLGLSGHDQLQHFVASPAWDDAPLWRALADEADRLVGGPGAALVIDDTALPKKGTLSVGVERRYCGQLGKRALMFVVNACRRDRVASAAPAELKGVWLLRSAGGRAAETTVSRL